MPRQSLVHYIAPSAISITPNCNGTASDLAVYLARDTKIRVNSDNADIGIDTLTGTYQEWTLNGRNRRLADSTRPYTIYARLNKTDKSDAYLVFVKKQLDGQVWKDKYPYVVKDGADGLYHDVYGQESQDYWYIRLGDVSLPVSGKRELTLDTGILGTDQYNEEWNLNPDSLPMRLELSATIDDEDVGPTPYVYWEQTLQLVASLIKGWSEIETDRLDHWEILRNSGDASADAEWPGTARAQQFAESGSIALSHSRYSDDFNGAVSATFTVNAWGYPDTDSSGTPQLQILKSATICIMAETLETFELISSTEIVSYNPQTQEYSPEGGVAINIRATDQRSDVFDMSTAQVTTCRLTASYAVVGDNTWTALTFSDVSGIATATIPISVFALQQSVNIRLLNGDGKEVSRKTIAFVRDGEDSKEREWIFLRSATPITFGDASSEHPKPSLISGGEVNPTGAAGGEDTNKNKDGWVPEGWWDEQRGTEENVPYEYGSYRNFIHATGDGSGSGDSPDGHWGDFTDPTIWSHFGKDGNGIVSITKTYAISAKATTADDNTAPSDITRWRTGSPATTPAKPYLWAKEVTVYTDTTKNTTKYYRIGSRGDNGIDAQDVEWVYIRTKTTTAPVIADDSAYTDHNGHTYADDDHLPRVVAEAGNTDIESNNSGDAEHPFECTDNPKGTDDTWKYEWEIKRTKGNADSTTHKRSWNTYSGTMILRTDPAFNRYINTILGGATGNATTVATAQNAILSALNSRIYQQGGLMLASLIAMRKLKQDGDPDQLSDYDTWGGISGQYDADARGYGIASWCGGDMIDYESLTAAEKAAGWGSGTGQQRWARSLFRFDGSGYLSNGNISWDAVGNATFKGSISTLSTVGGSDWQTFIRSKQITYDSAIQNLQDQIEGSIETVYGDVDPTEEGNDPYAEYSTKEKIKHLGDNYYDTVSGYAYRYTTSVDPETSEDLYYWTLITDSGITEAIAKAGEALNVANTKGKIFSTTNNTLPSPPYNQNDIWVNATGEWAEDGQTYKYSNEIMKCTTARTTSGTQKITDWQLANGYTAGINTAKGLAEAAQGNLDGLVAQILNGTGASGDSYITAGSALHVIKEALVDGSSFQSGGLFMTNFIAMRDPTNNSTVWGGLSGVYNPKDETETGGEKGHGIAAWYGGANVDIETLTGTAKTTYDNLTPTQRKSSSAYAKTLFRFDGSGYVAGTNISWNAAGDVTIKGKTVTATTAIDTPVIYLNGTNITTVLSDLLDMFEKDTTSEPGTTLIKAKYSLYSVGAISALGAASGGGGGGGGQGDVTWALLEDNSDDRQIAVSHLTGLLNGSFSGKDYAVKKDFNGKLYVSVPWENTTYSAGSGLSLSGTKFSVKIPSSGAWFGGTAFVGSDGVMEVGRYIDFHPTNASTLDYSARIDCGTSTTAREFTLPNDGGTILTSGNSSVSKSGDTLTVKINGISQSLTNTYTTYSANNGVGLTGTTFYNSGVRSTTINGNYLRVNTNGTNDDLTIPYATNAGTALVANKLNVMATINGQNTANYPWRLLAQSAEITTNYVDTEAIIVLRQFAVGGRTGTIKIAFRTNEIATTASGVSAVWLDRFGFAVDDVKIAVYWVANKSYADVFVKATAWNRMEMHIIGNRSWSFVSSSEGVDGASPVNAYASIEAAATAIHGRAYTNIVSAQDGGIVSYANSAGAATNDSDGNAIKTTYLKIADKGGLFTDFNNIIAGDDINKTTITIGGTTKKIVINYATNANSAAKLTTVSKTLFGNTYWTSEGIPASIGTSSSPAALSYVTNIDSLLYFDRTNNRIGIGANNPSYKLHVAGTGYFSDNLTFANNKGIYMKDSDGEVNNVLYLSSSNQLILGSETANEGYNTYLRGGAVYLQYGGSNTGLIINNSGNVGIGTTSPSYKLHVSGDIYATGGVTSLSDIRKKNVIDYELPLTVEQIAAAPTIRFTWKDKREEGEQVGTVAQYWQKVLPQVTRDKNDELSMQYGVAALVANITTARKVVDHEKLLQEQARKIEEQAKKIRELKEELYKLKIA